MITIFACIFAWPDMKSASYSGGGGIPICWTLQVCEAERGVLFNNFMNGTDIQKSEGLNGRGPKNEASNHRGS